MLTIFGLLLFVREIKDNTNNYAVVIISCIHEIGVKKQERLRIGVFFRVSKKALNKYNKRKKKKIINQEYPQKQGSSLESRARST